jgi:hypothetical protein
LVDDTASNLLVWQSQEYQGVKYMRIQPSNPDRGFGRVPIHRLYYLVTPKQLLLSPNEDVVKRAIDKKNVLDACPPWLGESAGVQFTGTGIEMVKAMFNDEYYVQVQRASWENLPILNEWHRLFPKQDPVDVHYKYSHTRLVCAGGGSYVWNPDWGTMESTACGHPGSPRKPRKINWDWVKNGNFGITLQDNQMRARVSLEID